MGEEMKGTTRYLDATVMEYALLDHARLRTPYGTQDDVRAYAAGGEKAALHDLALALADMTAGPAPSNPTRRRTTSARACT